MLSMSFDRGGGGGSSGDDWPVWDEAHGDRRREAKMCFSWSALHESPVSAPWQHAWPNVDFSGLFCHSFTSQTMTCEGPRKTFTFATRTDVGWVWLPVLSLTS